MDYLLLHPLQRGERESVPPVFQQNGNDTVQHLRTEDGEAACSDCVKHPAQQLLQIHNPQLNNRVCSEETETVTDIASTFTPTPRAEIRLVDQASNLCMFPLSVLFVLMHDSMCTGIINITM